jgi:2-polyprenyl-3-methyl-5-hydroxy-6-metoxy-1,4-benzoquinol methylase
MRPLAFNVPVMASHSIIRIRMRPGWLEALRMVRGHFSRRPWRIRAHILGRFLTCPFLRILPEIDRRGRVLDLGAGHGLLACMAADAGHEVIAVDPDLRKIANAASGPGIRFVAGTEEAIRGRFATVTMIDVLYRIPITERDALFRSIHGKLEPGGVFLIKDLDPGHPLKSSWNRIQEWISDHLFGLTLGSEFAYETTADVRSRLLRAGFDTVTVRSIGRFYPHAHVLFRAEVAAL